MGLPIDRDLQGRLPSRPGVSPGGLGVPSGPGVSPGGLGVPSGPGVSPGGLGVPSGPGVSPGGLGVPSGPGVSPGGVGVSPTDAVPLVIVWQREMLEGTTADSSNRSSPARRASRSRPSSWT